jgi:oxygen-independent coproporphyrinogen-3 oxidase
MWGIDINLAESLFGMDNKQMLLRKLHHQLQAGTITEVNGHYILTQKGKLFADAIASELFMD